MSPPQNLDPDNYDAEPDMRWSLRTSRRISSRIPAMEDAAWVRSWSGVDGNTPDGHLILDKAPGIEGLYSGGGDERHGFQDRTGGGEVHLGTYRGWESVECRHPALPVGSL